VYAHLECGSYVVITYNLTEGNLINMDKNFSKSILCVVAHPDDEALGIGGTIIKHINKGDKVNIVIFSVGEAAKSNKDINASRRLKSAKEWSARVGSNIFRILDYPDQKLDTIPKLEIIQSLEKILKALRPDILYIHHDGDINHDHQIVSHAVLTALRPMNSLGLKSQIRTFETVSSTEQAPYTERYIFKPNFYVDIEDVWEKKIKALEAYKAETSNFPHPRSIDSLHALAVKRGVESGLKKAEAFCIIRKIWQ
jgi:N-acetylglucosamine malate deacetylase 1